MKRVIKNIKNASLSIKTAFEDFIALKKSEGAVAQTLSSYRTHIRCFMAYCDGRKIECAEQIDKGLVDAYKSYLVDRDDITVETKNTYLRALKCFVSYLVSIEEVQSFNIRLFNTPSKASVPVYSDEEIKKVLNCPYVKSKVFSERRDYAMMLTLLLTGARRSTVVNMKIDDIDFDNDLVTLQHIKRDNQFQIRQIPLNPDLKTALAKYIRVSEVGKYSSYLFPNVEGKPLHPDTANKRMKKLFNASGVEFRGCHEFRRTFASKAYCALGDIEQTRKLMMIADPRVLKRYVNTDMKMLKESVQQLAFVTQIQAQRPLRGALKKGA